MRKFKVTVNGKCYDISVEEIFEDDLENSMEAAVIEAAILEQEQTQPDCPVVSQYEATKPSVYRLSAPIGGIISSVLVETGKTVEKDACGIILNKQGREHEVLVPVCGRVLSVEVCEGQQVDEGNILITLEQPFE